MKKSSRLLACTVIALTCVTGASANISWTFNDVNFYLGSWSPTGTVYTEVASLTGSFSTNNSVTAVTNFSNLKVTAQPGYGAYAFSIAGMVNDYLPGTIGIFAAGWGSYIDLDLTSPLTNAGGSYSFSAGYDCPGCAVLEPGSGAAVGDGSYVSITNEVTAAPEPGLYMFLAIGLAGLGFVVRRARAITRT